MPQLKIKSLHKDLSFPIVRKALAHRDWFGKTDDARAYHCKPMTDMNLHGWEFILPHDVEVVWDGISDVTSNHVKILKGENLKGGSYLVDTNTGFGTITFNIDCVLETDPDHYIIMQGAPNHFVDGAQALNAVVRSDIYHHGVVQFSYRLTEKDKIVKFKAGEPYCFIYIYPKSLLANTELVIEELGEEQKQKVMNYAMKRMDHYAEYNSPSKFYKKDVDNAL